MTLSEVFYEAACRMSDCSFDKGYFSCNLVHEISSGRPWNGSDRSVESWDYSKLMTTDPNDPEDAADELGWSAKDFRTFMLLMASEAVK